jgi:hypothetical protein
MFKEFIAIISTFTIVTFTAVLFKMKPQVLQLFIIKVCLQNLLSIPSIASGNLMLIITCFFLYLF